MLVDVTVGHFGSLNYIVYFLLDFLGFSFVLSLGFAHPPPFSVDLCVFYSHVLSHLHMEWDVFLGAA